MTERVLHLTVGLPGAGKTTLARRIAAEERILRLTPDEWMVPLFHHNDAGGRRDILEGRLIWTAHQVLARSSVVLDFGCWSPEERWALRAIAESVGARFALHHLHVDEPTRRARARHRWETAPETTFPRNDADHDDYLARCIPPSEAELTGAPIPAPPAPHGTWFSWASERWPGLPCLDPAQLGPDQPGPDQPGPDQPGADQPGPDHFEPPSFGLDQPERSSPSGP